MLGNRECVVVHTAAVHEGDGRLPGHTLGLRTTVATGPKRRVSVSHRNKSTHAALTVEAKALTVN